MKEKSKQMIKKDQKKHRQCKNQKKTSKSLKWLFPERRLKTLFMKWTLAESQKEHSEKKGYWKWKKSEQKCKSSTQGIEVKETFEKAEQEDRDSE